MFRQGQNSYPAGTEQLSRRDRTVIPQRQNSYPAEGSGAGSEKHNRAAAVLHNKKGGQKI